MNISFKKSWIPNIIIVVLFAVIATIYFYPALEGYSLRQGDIVSHKGMSKEIADFRKAYDSEPLWTNSMFGGMPTYQTSTYYSTGYAYINRIIQSPFSSYAFLLFLAFTSFFILLKSVKTNTILSFLGGLIYGLSTYNLLIIEAGHNTKMKTLAIVPLTLGLLIMFLKNKGNKLLYGALFGLTFGFQLYFNHIQMTYYFAFLFAGIVIHFIVKDLKSNLKNLAINKVAILVCATLLAVLSNFSNIYNTKEFTKHTMRGNAIIDIQKDQNTTKENITSSGLKKDYITGWSYGIGETYNLLVPNAKGNSRHLTNEFFDELKIQNPNEFNKAVKIYQQSRGQFFKGYWGNQPFTSGPNYVGAIMVFLALMYLILMPGKLKWGIIIPTILAIMLAWGKNFMFLTDIFIDYFPLYNKFRTVSSFLVVANLTIPLMAILFLNKVIEDKEWREKNVDKITKIGGGIILIVLAVAMFPFLFDFMSEREMAMTAGMNNADVNSLMETLVDFRKSVFRTDSFKTIAQMAIALALIIGFIKSKIKSSWLVIGIGAITVINIWMIDKQFMNNEKSKGKYLSWEKSSKLSHSIMAQPGDLAIYNKEKNKTITDIVNTRIKGFRKQEGRRITNQDKQSIMFSTLGFNTNYRVLDLSNPFASATVSYFHKATGGYSPAKLRRIQDMIDFYITDELSLLASSPQKMKVLNMLNTKYFLKGGQLSSTNQYAMGNAWFIDNVNLVNSNNEEILAIKDVNPSTTAIVHNSFSDVISKKSYPKALRTIQLEKYLPNHLIYKSNCSELGMAVFSEIYYSDGWNAYIDGKKVDYVRANYLLRALEIPKGEHKIEFKFEPTMFNVGNWINLIGFSLLFITIIFFSIKKKNR